MDTVEPTGCREVIRARARVCHNQNELRVTYETNSRLGSRASVRIRRRLTQLGVVTTHPLAFLLVGVYGMCWYAFDRESFNWHAVAALGIWFMTLVIQRAEHRDTQAIQAKLDELIHAQADARNELTRIDQEEPEVIERMRAEARKND